MIPPRRVGLGVDPINRPDAAIRFLREKAPPGRIFNLLGFGGYIIHELWPDRRVYLDGRLDVFPDGFLTAYQEMMTTGEGWEATVTRYDIAFALVDYTNDPRGDRGLRALLRSDNHWVCVCFGDNFVLYARRMPSNEALIQQFGTPFDPSLRSWESIDQFVSTAAAEDVEEAIRALDNIVRFLPDEIAPYYVLGQLLHRAGRPSEAVEYLRALAGRNPSARNLRLSLVRALMAAGVGEEAREELVRITSRYPNDVGVLILLSDVEKASGNPEVAVEILTRAAALAPRDHTIRLRLGIMHAEQGRFSAARACFQEAMRIQPSDPAARRNLETLRRLEQGSGSHGP